MWESQKLEGNLVQEYYKQSVKLYYMLIEPALKLAKKEQIKHLILAPEDQLNLLAFEAMCLLQKEKTQS